VAADSTFTLVSRYSLEPSDIVDTSAAGRIAFKLTVAGTGIDGFNFTLPSGASWSLLLSGGGSVRVGSGALIASTPVVMGEASSASALYDQYGGYTKAFAGASPENAFRVQKMNGRWALITPEGNGFFSMGPNHVADGYNQRPFLLTRDFGGDRAKLAAEVVGNVKKWGYNTMGYGAVPESARLMPSFLRFSVEGPASASAGTPFADVFDGAVLSRNRSRARTAAASGSGNPFLIGYLYNDAALWDLTKSREKSVTKQHYVDFIRSLGSDRPGRARYEQFLQDKYGTISRLNAAYGTNFYSFGSITESSLKTSARAAVIADDTEFLGILAEQFYRTTREALRQRDADHLIFGDCNFLWAPPDPVLAAMRRSVDVISIQPMSGMFAMRNHVDAHFTAAALDDLESTYGMPVFICDHNDFERTAIPTGSIPSRASQYNEFLTEMYKSRAFIGYLKCAYMDRVRPAETHGFLDGDNKVREDLTDAYTPINASVLTGAYEGIRNLP
jgi:hypothetical protein